MNKFKLWVGRRLFQEFLPEDSKKFSKARVIDATNSTTAAGIVNRIGLRNGDLSSKEFEPPEFDLVQIANGYSTDSYIRQGVDKYIDQIFKEGYDFYGKEPNCVEYIKTRLSFMAEATRTPTNQFLIDIAEDVVKYANCIIVKARAKDSSMLPSGVKATGLNGALPVAGYFCANATTITVKRDKYGTPTGWQQEVDGADKPVKFRPEDVVHFYYKREKGNGFGTSFLIPVLDDVRALRQSEENVVRMMYRNIYPFYHVRVGDEQMPGTDQEISQVEDIINNMDIEGGLITTNRVELRPIASDKVINAQPYLKYLEERVFSGLGVPGIMFGRGNTANKNTGDNMSSEMGDRIKAIQRVIETFFNAFILKELLMEGGYDPVLNSDHMVEFKFRNNDVDLKIKSENQAGFLYEHNAVTEDEMRADIGRDPITDRAKMHLNIVTAEKQALTSKETDNKVAPKNQHSSPSKEEKLKKNTSQSKKTLSKDNLDALISFSIDIIDEKRTCDSRDLFASIEDIRESLKEATPFFIVEKDENISRTSKAIDEVMDAIKEKLVFNTKYIKDSEDNFDECESVCKDLMYEELIQNIQLLGKEENNE